MARASRSPRRRTSRSAPLSPYPVEQRGSRHLVLLGDLVAQQQLEVVLRVRFPYGPVGEEVGILVAASDPERVLASAGAGAIGIGWEFADDRTNDAQARDRAVDRAVARLFAARARQEAVVFNRAGDSESAVRRLRRVADRIASYAGDDHDLRAIAKSLRAEEQHWARPQSPSLRKMAFASSSYELRSRAVTGEARRRPSA